MNNKKTHLRINHPSGAEAPTFFVTACGLRHLHSGQVLGGSVDSFVVSTQRRQFDEIAVYHARVCLRCRSVWSKS